MGLVKGIDLVGHPSTKWEVVIDNVVSSPNGVASRQYG